MSLFRKVDSEFSLQEVFDVDELLGPSDLIKDAVDVNDTSGVGSENAPEVS